MKPDIYDRSWMNEMTKYFRDQRAADAYFTENEETHNIIETFIL